MLAVSCKIENGPRGEDRAVVHREGDRLLIVVADGAGGASGASIAAQTVCDAAVAAFTERRSWARVLRDVDLAIARSRAGGLCTAVVVEVCGAELSGASVGDSGAWLVEPTAILDLTGQQNRKPLVGSGEAEPVVFGPTTFRAGRLLVASDGLFKCARRSEIQRRAITGALEDSALALVEAVRLRSGRFQDDVAVVLAETAATAPE